MSRMAETWIVVADGARAFVFEEARRLGAVHARADLHWRAEGSRTTPRARREGLRPLGRGRAGVDARDPARAAEARFLRQIARRIEAAASAGAFAHLVIMAPPSALGALRSALRADTSRRLELCDPHERCDLDAEGVRDRLRVLRGRP